MRRLISFILTLLIGLSFGGNSAENSSKQFSLELSRTSCYGSCPIYPLRADSSGIVEFEGVDFTEVKGKVETRLSDEEIKKISDEIQKSKFFTLDNDYGYESKNCQWILTDQSGVFLTIEIDGRKKTIDHYQGCQLETGFWQKSPLEELSKLENKIDEIVGTKQWIGKNN